MYSNNRLHVRLENWSPMHLIILNITFYLMTLQQYLIENTPCIVTPSLQYLKHQAVITTHNFIKKIKAHIKIG